MIAARRLDLVLLKPFSRRWWAAWHDRAASGQSVDAMTHSGRRGVPWQAAADSVPSDLAMVAVEVRSPAFGAWLRHYETRGVKMPIPRWAPVAFMPGALPPERLQ